MNFHRYIVRIKIAHHVLKNFPRLICYPSKKFTTLCHYERYTVSSKFPMISSCVRTYAKGKDKVKSGNKKIEIREDIMSEAINVVKYKAELQEAIDQLKDYYIKHVSLRSAAGAIEILPIEFEGDQYTLQDLAQINRKNPKLLALNFSSFPQTIPTVLEVLRDSGMNLNPQQDGTSIYIPIPKITREHRENLSKNAKNIFNKCKDNIRQVQNKYIKKLEVKDLEGMSADKLLFIKEQIMALANEYSKTAEKLKNDKQKELLIEN